MNDLSVNNSKILEDYSKNEWNKLTNSIVVPEKKQTLLGKVFSWLPTSRTVGRLFGGAYGQTYGAQCSNQVIEAVGVRVLRNEAESLTWGQWTTQKMVGSVETPIIEAAKLVITPNMVPLLAYLGTAAGGVTLPTFIAIISALSGRILGSKKSIEELPNFETLLMIDDATGNYIDSNGNILTPRDLKDLKKALNRFDIACRLKSSTKDEIDSVIKEYLEIEENEMEYQDGTVISSNEKDYRRIQKAIERLKGTNPTNNTKGIHFLIKTLSKHVKPVEPKPLMLTDEEDNSPKLLTDSEVIEINGESITLIN